MRGSTDTDERPAVPDLPALIDRWLVDGVISQAQADRMRVDLGLIAASEVAEGPVEGPVEGSAEPRHPKDTRPRTPLVAEALAYLGGVIVLVAAGLIAARYWGSLGEAGQLGVVGGAAAVLLLAGIAVPRSDSGATLRLRSVLWMLSTAGTAGFLALFGNLVLELSDSANALVAASGAAALAAVLWWRLPVLLQQVTFFAATMTAAGAAVAELTTDSSLPGLAVWGTGAIWFLLGWRGTVKPRRLVLALAAIGILVGALMTMPANAGMVLALCTLVAVVVVAVVVRDLLLLAVGAVGALNILPAVVNEWFPGDLAAPLVLLGVGALLVTAAVYIATLRRQ